MRFSLDPTHRSAWLLLATFIALCVAACSLNGQPTPPIDDNPETEDASSSSSNTADAGGTRGEPIFSDAAPSSLDAQTDAPLDAQADVLDASSDGG